MTGDEIRQAYLDFFAERGHLVLDSAPLVPKNDPSLLWINAGMAPFKPYFDGRETPPEVRIATSQKCIRTNDIENVGRTDRHHTFFEMLGNFSFGDYFKHEAITWAWEFVTEVLKLEVDRLWITIHIEDDQAYEIWREIGVAKARILRKDKENFWEVGTGTGPCGPCSEIHYDRGKEYGESEEDVVGGEGDRFLEIWNLVFTQFDQTESGEYLPLPNKNIDTGMGLERVASILQGVESNFETDLLKPIIDYLVKDTGVTYNKSDEIKTAYRVIADHIRTVTMAVFDGVAPSNEGRGYVIRRLLRRAVRYGGILGYDKPFLAQLVPVVIEIMGGAYPQLQEKEEYIQTVVQREEERFLQTLEQGLFILQEKIDEMEKKGNDILTGQVAFTLYDTYGFPLDLTKDVLVEKGYQVDEAGFLEEMEKQRQRARQAREDHGFSGGESVRTYNQLKQEIGKDDNNQLIEFTGYEKLADEARIIGILQKGEKVNSLAKGEKGEIILESTPFYAESGGQVGDQGTIVLGQNKAKIYDTKKKAELIVHLVEVETGEFVEKQEVEVQVTCSKRQAISRNHSATHLIHKALKEVLGEHVNQAGSSVSAKRLRFDFNHHSSLNEKEIKAIENRVNEIVLQNLKVDTLETSIEKANKLGAEALFGEKYEDEVRVVSMGDYSLELCGGTHVKYTGEIGLVKIISESSVAAGIRRIEAITGLEVLDFIRGKERILKEGAHLLKSSPDKLLGMLNNLVERESELVKEISSLKERLAGSVVDDLIKEVEDINGVPLLVYELKDMENEALRKLSDQLKDKLGSAIIILASKVNNKVIFVAAVTKDLVAKGYHAGKLIGKVAKITGGGGGGRPDMAQAGGQNPDKIQAALKEAKKIILKG